MKLCNADDVGVIIVVRIAICGKTIIIDNMWDNTTGPRARNILTVNRWNYGRSERGFGYIPGQFQLSHDARTCKSSGCQTDSFSFL